MRAVVVALLIDLPANHPYHLATLAALGHASEARGIPIDVQVVPHRPSRGRAGTGRRPHRSDLEWTTAYASMLADGPATGSVAVIPEGTKRRMSEKISRADVAAWMLQAATSVERSRRGVGITGSTRTSEASPAAA